jgi:hypothetical protein
MVLNASQKGLLEWMVECGGTVVFAEAADGDGHDMVMCGNDDRAASRHDLEVLVRQGLVLEVAADSFHPTEHGLDLGGRWR